MANATQTKIKNIITEMADVHKERNRVIQSLAVGLVSQQHVLLIGPGGTGKSFICRDLTSRITGATFFETALDETTDPSQVFGPPDIKAMVEDGKTRRIPTGMLPEADIAYFDEYFNANTPLLHSLRPILNERYFHNNGQPVQTPLKMAVMGTNVINADTSHAPDWDRVHIREQVSYVKDRDEKMDLVMQTIARRLGTDRASQGTRTTVTLEEVEQAHKEALQIKVPDNTVETFLDIHDELRDAYQIHISDRRVAQGMQSAMAAAYINGHDEVTVGDLDVLSSMWWLTLDQRKTVEEIVLTATNPGAKEAMDLLDSLAEQREEYKAAKADDPVRGAAAGLQVYRDTRQVKDQAEELLKKAQAGGTSTTRIQDVIDGATSLMDEIEEKMFE